MLLRQLLGREHDCHGWVRQIIGVTIGIGAIAFQQMPTSAQITPDDTLPNNSQVTRIDNIRLIWGGTQAGSNLFHSFSEFSVPTGNGAYFFNGTDIQNIFSRVTGGSVSNIDGLIAANGNANLFLINPNGIIFGNNARLNIGGSFLASTASSLKFADGKEFNATTPQNAPLLSIGVPLGLQFGESPKAIVNESGYGILSIFADFFNIPPGLKVEPEKTLGLVGGDIILKEGTLRAPDGRIELGSVGSGSFVSLTPTNAGFVLGYEGVNRFQDIRLSQQSIAVTDGDSGGSIQLQGKNVTLSDGSFISANTTGSGTGGGLTVNASESVQVAGSSPDSLFLGGLRVRVTKTATGKAGDMRINTPTLLVQDGAQISVGVFGSGKGGNLIVNASKEVQLVGESTNSLPSGLYSETLGTGNAGDITITTPVLLVRSGAGVGTGTSGSGKGGVLTVNASESVQLVGGTSSDNAIALGASASKTATGQAGDLKINTSVLLLKDGAQISVGTFGVGKGGNLIVNASQKVELIGESADSQFASGLFSETRGVGNAGDITIATPVLLLRDGAQIDASTSGSGKGGNLTVNTSKQVQLIGTTANGEFSSGLFTRTTGTATGEAGSLTITTPVLLVQGGAKVDASTYGAGKGGNLNVNVFESVELLGTSANGTRSALLAGTERTGDAGNLTINTGSLTVGDGAQIAVGTSGAGKGGNITVNASKFVQLISSGLSTQATNRATGQAGDLRINTPVLLLKDGAQVSVGTFDAGKGGNLIVNASKEVQLIGKSNNGPFPSGLFSETLGTGDAGNITITTPVLLLKNGAQVSVGTFGAGKGGNLIVNTSQEVQLIGSSTIGNQVASSGLLSETQGTGNAGDITIATPVLLIRDGARIDAGTRSSGNGGNLTVRASKQVQLIGTSGVGDFSSSLRTQSSQTATGDAGSLTIATPILLIQNGAEVSASTLGRGRGGNIEVTANRVDIEGVSASGRPSALGSETKGIDSSANAGNVTLTTRTLNIRDRAYLSTVSSNEGQAGNITIRVDESLNTRNGSIFTSSRLSSGGSVNITAQDIRLFGDSDIFTSVFSGAGNGGDIRVTANSIIAFDDSDILAFARDGKGGNITLNTPAFFGENYRPAPRGTEPRTLDGNKIVDVNATGRVSGIIRLPDTTSIQNSLTELPQNLIDTNALIANSCIVRSKLEGGSFTIVGSGGFPNRPGDANMSVYSTGVVSGVENSKLGNSKPPLWQKGDPIIEATGVYRLDNGQLVMSRECH